MIASSIRAALIAGVCATGASAQGVPPWGPPPGSRGVSLEVLRPSWDGPDLDVASGLLYATVRVPISGVMTVIGEAPLAYFSLQSVSSTVLGNLYVGVEHAEAGGFVADGGVRLPTASESGNLGSFGGALAFFSDFDRGEAWTDRAWAVRGHVGYRHAPPGELETGIRAGMTAWLLDEGDNEVFGDYRAHAVYRHGKVALGGEFTGRAILTASGGDFASRTVHQATLAASVAVGAARPRVSLRFPIDADLKDFGLNHVLGIGLDWTF